jgi:hypothetical protein
LKEIKSSRKLKMREIKESIEEKEGERERGSYSRHKEE